MQISVWHLKYEYSLDVFKAQNEGAGFHLLHFEWTSQELAGSLYNIRKTNSSTFQEESSFQQDFLQSAEVISAGDQSTER